MCVGVEDVSGGGALWIATEGKGTLRNDLGTAQVHDLEESLGVDEQMLRFEVSVDHVVVPEVLQRRDDVGRRTTEHRRWTEPGRCGERARPLGSVGTSSRR